MKKSLHSVLSIILSFAICFGGMIMTVTPTALAAVSSAEAALSLEAAQEGMVLLKNQNQALPLATRTVALFGGAGAMRTGATGTGAESNRPAYTVSVYDGLKNAGFTITSEKWLKAYDAEYQAGFSQWEYTPWAHFNLPETPISQEDLATAATGTDTAIYVIRRLAGEGSDRQVREGDYLLDTNEMNNLTAIANTFDKVIVLLNTCGPIDMSFTDTIKNIDAILYISLPGMEGGNAVASLLTGNANPSGKLSATWAKTYNDYPSAQAFMNTNQQILSEDIYVGYRWFETFAGEDQKVAYPFGFGLSYTNFSLTDRSVTVNNRQITATVTVTNTGSLAGKEVVQIYHGAPQGKLGKSAVSLIGYQKTKLLQPGEAQTVSITFDIADMASYDDEGVTGNPSCYVLEAGDYPIYIGTDSHSAKNHMGGTYTQEQLKVVQQLTQYGTPVTSFTKVINTENGKSTAAVVAKDSTANAVPSDLGKQPMTNTTGKTLNYSQVLADPRLMDDYLAQFSVEELADYVRLASGPCAGVMGGSQLNNETPVSWFIDGVSGLNTNTNTASYPSPTCLAQTFNDELVSRVSAAVAQQMIAANFDTVLAPGVNIQQNPLCGRNFGYFSEDPYLSGKIGAAYVRGVQSQGIGTSPKHFAVNNKEDCRSTVDSVLTERALREIYLKSFQITVEEGNPWAIMTSYNKINGVEAPERSDLINGILRNEWGFDGVVMTDWGNNSSEVTEKMAGCDLNTYGTVASAAVIVNAVNSGNLSLTALQQAAKNILKVTMKSYKNVQNDIYAGIQSVYKDQPSVIQAEAFNGKSAQAGDVGFEDCGDIGGGKNPTNTNQGKVLYYCLNVELAGVYRFTPRVAAMSTDGSLALAVDQTNLGSTTNFSVTNGWQTYQDQPYIDVVLPQGMCELAITCNGSGYNLNYYTLEPLELAKVVTVVHQPDALSVPYNTAAKDLALPTTVTVTLNDDTTALANVEWNLSDYNPLYGGKQTIYGNVVPSEGIYNTANLTSSLVLQVGANPNPVTKVTISSHPKSLKQGEQATLVATVEGEGDFIPDVIWSVNSYLSTITADGVLTIGEKETANSVKVTATSVTDSTIKHTVTIGVIKNRRFISSTETTRLMGVDYDSGSRAYGTEDCADTTGGKNITDFNQNGWIEFECNVEASGTYNVTFRYAAAADKSGQIQFLSNGSLLGETQPLSYSGGWQSWANSETLPVYLAKGEQTIRLCAVGVNFNFNYADITPVEIGEITLGKVNGTVSGATNLSGLSVGLSGTNGTYQTQTDSSGKFTLEVLPGNYTLTISGNEIVTHSQPVTIEGDTNLNVTVRDKDKKVISATEPTRLFGIDYDNGSRPYGKEACEDTTGGYNITDFNENHWVDFNCYLEGSGTYSIQFRYASPLDRVSSIQFHFDNTLLAETQKLATTGGWQTWKDSETLTITMAAGAHTIRLQANGNNFNFNYVEIKPIDVEVKTTHSLNGAVTCDGDASTLTVTLTKDGTSVETIPTQNGSFTFAELDEGEYQLTVSGKGYDPVVQTVVVPTQGDVSITVTAIPYGDVDGDGQITAADALTILKAVVGNITLTQRQTQLADVDGDAQVGAADALWILKYVVGKVERFPVQ